MKKILKYGIALIITFLFFNPLESDIFLPLGIKEIKAKTVPYAYSIDTLPGLVQNNKIVKAGLLFDVNQNKIVWEKGMFASFPIASLSKIMTVLLVMEDLAAEKITMKTSVLVTHEASIVASSKLWMKPGQVFSIEDLIKSSMISSANDACYLLGQFCSGSENAFVARMNERAFSLGMYNTFFSNTTGLPAPPKTMDNFSSPHDLLILSRELLKYQLILDIAAMDKEKIYAENQRFELKNHNRLAVNFPEVDGLKTGYTRKAGFCMVATVEKAENRLIAIVLGALSPGARNDFVTHMFDNYYSDILCLSKLTRAEEPLIIKK